MLSKSDEEILDDRLRNWGRWAADKHRVGSTLLWRMMKLYGKKEKEDDDAQENDVHENEERQEFIPVDENDAVIVNRAWQALPESPLRYHSAKWVLAAHFCYPYVSQRMVCRQLKIDRRHYETLLNLAKYLIFNKIAYNASKRLSCCDC